MRVAIIGAGIAGLSCADALSEDGHEIVLFDKARGPGGRMSTRRYDSAIGMVSFDHGASHFTARSADFRALVSAWHEQGIVAPWPIAGRDAWVGTPGMNAPVKAMSTAHMIYWNTPVKGISHNVDGWWCIGQRQNHGPFDTIILAVPAEQAVPIVAAHDFQMARQAMAVQSRPCWAAMYAFASPLDGLPDLVRHEGAIGWAVRNSAKPGRTGPEAWVVQAAAGWSQIHVEDDADQVAACLLNELAHVAPTDIPAPVVQIAHRWRYAIPSGSFAESLWNANAGIGLCGDWLAHGFVEQAWQSGKALAHQILGRARYGLAQGRTAGGPNI